MGCILYLLMESFSPRLPPPPPIFFSPFFPVVSPLDAFLKLNSGTPVDLRVRRLRAVLTAEHGSIIAHNDAMQRSLEVYVPLQFAMKRPPLATGEPQGNLETFMRAVLVGTETEIFDCFPARHRPKPHTRTIFIQAMAGLGKSNFCWRAMQYYSSELTQSEVQRATTRLPIVITLPAVQARVAAASADFLFDSIVEAYPQLQHAFLNFTAAEKTAFHNLSFVFFLDGVDELGELSRLINTLYNPVLWCNSYFIITARTEVLSSDVINRDIAPALFPRAAAGSSRQPQPQMMSSLYLLPFTDQQREKYISVFASKYCALYPTWPSAASYNSSLHRFSGLKSFLSEPLLLFLVLSVLPTLDAQTQTYDNGANTDLAFGFRLNPDDLYVVDGKTLTGLAQQPFPVVRKAELYSLFAHQWVQREVRRQLGPANETEQIKNRVVDIMDLCKKLAFEMFARGISQIDIPSRTSLSALLSSKIPSERKLGVKLQNSVPLAIVEIYETKQLDWQCSPIKKTGDTFSFLHKTIQEFFAALYVMQSLPPNFQSLSKPALVMADLALSQHWLNKGNDNGILRFCADLIDKNVQNYITGQTLNNLQSFSKTAWDIIEASRRVGVNDPLVQNGCVPTAAGNALMILNAAGLVFYGVDFSDAKLSHRLFASTASITTDLVQITSHHREYPPLPPHVSTPPPAPVATIARSSMTGQLDLSGGVFSNCNFTRAHLQGARLDCTDLSASDFKGANMSAVSFGQMPTLTGHTSWVRSVCVTADQQFLVSGGDDQAVKVWQFSTGECLRTLTGHTGGVESVCVTADQQFLVSGSRDQAVKVWQFSTGRLVRHLGSITTLSVQGMGVKGAVSLSDLNKRLIKSLQTPVGDAELQTPVGEALQGCRCSLQ